MRTSPNAISLERKLCYLYNLNTANPKKKYLHLESGFYIARDWHTASDSPINKPTLDYNYKARR